MKRFGIGESVADWLWFLALGVVSSVWCIGAAHSVGTTFDETTYFEQGLKSWHTGSHRGLMKLGTMPLPLDLDALPLYFWERWHGRLLDPQTDLNAFLSWFRAGTLFFWWFLLYHGRLAGRQLAGPWGGRLAVALLACEPSLLAHASLATTDVAISACLLALVYHFRTARQAGWLRRVGVPTVLFAAAVLSKASGLVFAPICLLLVEIERLRAAGAFRPAPGAPAAAGQARSAACRAWLRRAWAELRPFRRDWAQIFSAGLVLVFLYCGSDWQPEHSFVAWARGLPEGMCGSSILWLAEHLRIFSNAGEGLVKQITHNCRGHGVFLFGITHPRAVWYYFPVTLTIKLSTPLLLLTLLLTVLRPRSLTNWACWATAGLLAFTIFCRVQIGIRLVLPLVVLGIVGLAAATVQTWSRYRPGWGRRLLGAVAGAGFAWTTLAAALVWPNGLCYTNELWGGTARGYRCLSDSNYDWGQGLKELARWQQRRGLPPLDVWYFGTDPALRTLPLRPLYFQCQAIDNPRNVLEAVHGHYLAVSTTYLYGAFATASQAQLVTAAFLRSQRPVDRTQTFLIYDFTGQDLGSITARSP